MRTCCQLSQAPRHCCLPGRLLLHLLWQQPAGKHLRQGCSVCVQRHVGRCGDEPQDTGASKAECVRQAQAHTDLWRCSSLAAGCLPTCCLDIAIHCSQGCARTVLNAGVVNELWVDRVLLQRRPQLQRDLQQQQAHNGNEMVCYSVARCHAAAAEC